MKFITEFYGEIVKKAATPEVINKLKEVVRRKMSYHYLDTPYTFEDILKHWSTTEDTGFYMLRTRQFRSHTSICANAERLPEFEESIATAKGYRNERKTKKERQDARCFILAWENLGGSGNNAVAVSVEVYVNPEDELIPIAIPDDLIAFETQVKEERLAAKQEVWRKKEEARRSKPMTITVGMWEDLTRKISELERRYDD